LAWRTCTCIEISNKKGTTELKLAKETAIDIKHASLSLSLSVKLP
jgi:hypothetical protein